MKEVEKAKAFLEGKLCDVCDYYLVCMTNSNKDVQIRFDNDTCEKWTQTTVTEVLQRQRTQQEWITWK